MRSSIGMMIAFADPRPSASAATEGPKASNPEACMANCQKICEDRIAKRIANNLQACKSPAGINSAARAADRRLGEAIRLPPPDSNPANFAYNRRQLWAGGSSALGVRAWCGMHPSARPDD